jgi:hypothetical protein
VLQGVTEYSVHVELDESVKIDLLVVGCVAVSTKGMKSHCDHIVYLYHCTAVARVNCDNCLDKFTSRYAGF